MGSAEPQAPDLPAIDQEDSVKIGIIVGSIREGRKGGAVGEWVHEIARGRQDEGVEYELLDLREFDVPLLTSATVPGAAKKQYDSEQVTAWSGAVDACDGYVFVTPEYNHGVPGAFKNAVDSLGSEWQDKPVGFVSYGAESGVRAVEHWRAVVANFHMVDVRPQVALSTFQDFDGETFTPQERRPGEVGGVLDKVVELARLLRPAAGEG